MRDRFDRSFLLQSGAFAALVFSCGLFCALPAARAQDNNGATQAQINRLENEMQTLSRAVFKGDQPPAQMQGAGGGTGDGSGGGATALADMQNRLTQLEMSIQTLTGKIEEQQHTIDQLRDQVSHLGGGITQPAAPRPGAAYSGSGMTTVEADPVPAAAPKAAMPGSGPDAGSPTATYTYTTGPSNGADAPTAAGNKSGFIMTDPNAPAPANAPTAGRLGTLATDGNGNPVPAAGGPTADYEAAFDLMRSQKYDDAQTAFDAFIRKYPDSDLVPNAMYWLGESYYVRNQFDKAAVTFAQGYQKYPKGPKAPDSLLKLGMALAGQGKTKDACVALLQLKKQYPAGSAPVLARGDQEIKTLKCDAAQ